MGWFFKLILSFLVGEIKELWKDGTIKAMAKDAVEYSESYFGPDKEHNEKKRDEAIKHLLAKAEEVGKELSHEGALVVVEMAVQRFLK
jgi:hypothetical protein